MNKEGWDFTGFVEAAGWQAYGNLIAVSDAIMKLMTPMDADLPRDSVFARARNVWGMTDFETMCEGILAAAGMGMREAQRQHENEAERGKAA